MLNGISEGYTNFSKFQKPPQILSTRRVTWIKHHTEDQQILGAAVQIPLPFSLNNCADDKSLRSLYEPIMSSMMFETA